MPAEPVFFARNKIQVAIKACTLAKADLKSIFHILDEKNREAAELQVTKLVNNPGQSAEEFSALCSKVRASYKITVTISGSDGEEIFGNDASMFDKPNIPDKIIRAFYSNVTTFQQTFNVFPLNTINLSRLSP